jgi:protein phosphatase PTC2/3
VLQGFLETDAAVVRLCAEARLDYAACTAVTAVVTGSLLTVGHLGDSKVVLGRVSQPAPQRSRGGGVMPPATFAAGGGGGGGGAVTSGVYLTTDHKPDLPAERSRITAAGGSLEYLSGGRPFIRGGDFAARQAAGDRPMQLNYSRALGGKDLKPFGLSAVPDVSQVQLGPEER